jgi:hypothetical protein
MPWICYSCGAKNPNSAGQCRKCGGTQAAPRKFYVHWVFGAAVFFFLFYIGSVYMGAWWTAATADGGDMSHAPLLQWVAAMFFYFICGGVVGFASDGKTIIEAGLGSLVGQAAAVFFLVYKVGIPVSGLALGAGLVIGCGLGVLGAWLGEKLQDLYEHRRAV